MAVTIPDFWNLLVAGRLTSRNSVPKLEEQFAKVKGAETQGNAVTLAQWLISHGVISRYQARVLLAGRPGPFTYGDYTVFDRHTENRLTGAFRAIHPATRHRVLLWFHSGPAVQSQQWWNVLAQQAAIFRQAVHPQVQRLYQLCDLGQFKFTVLEDLQGESALDRAAKSRIPWPVGCRIIRQATLGLARLFELGQLHGAIRPENLWIDEHENVKLILPPVARDLLEVPGPIDLSRAEPGSNLARQVDYMAPELAQPGQVPSGRTEIYALGCTLYHLLTGNLPYSGNDPLAKLSDHATRKVPSIDATIAPPLVGQVVAIMMAKDPQRRYAHARQLVDVLTQLLTQLDPRQLEWPASPISNKLPEYESWLTPYGLAPASRTSDAPDIAMPPILAASLKPVGGRSNQNSGLVGFAGSAPTPPLPSAAPKASQAASVRRPPPEPTAAPPGVVAAPATLKAAIPKPLAATNRQAAIQQEPTAAMVADLFGPPAMVFPPDDDFIAPITAKPKKQAAAKTEFRAEKSGEKKWLLIGGMGTVCVVVAVVLWLVTRGTHGGNSAADVNAPKSATENAAVPAEATPSDAGKKQKNAPSDPDTKPGGEPPVADPKAGNDVGADLKKGVATKAEANSEFQAKRIQQSFAASEQIAPVEPPLWESPTHGAPISTVFFPARAEAVLSLRPAELLARDDGEKIFNALGLEAIEIRRQLETEARCSLKDVSQLIVVWAERPNGDGGWITKSVFILRFEEGHQKVDVNSVAGGSTDAVGGSGDSNSFVTYIPANESGKILLVGPADDLSEISQRDSRPAPMNRDLEKLMQTSDTQRTVTLLWLPSSYTLLLGTVPLTGTKWSKLLAASRRFFEGETRAAALSMTLTNDNLFMELRVRGPLDESAEDMAKNYRDRLNRLSAQMKSAIAAVKVQPYGKAILNRFPAMLKTLAEYTRSGADSDQSILRCYLPAAAMTNLLMAGELALSEAVNSEAIRAVAVDDQSKPPETIAEKLKRKTTLSFVNEPLDRTMSLLADDLGIKIEILGSDLQLDGITKNQAIRDLNEHDKPANEILRDIMFKANP
ncbi:MAG TPA: protein kinase, partial [Pirellulales bacterium]